MRIVSDVRAAPLASFLPFKAANCRGAQRERDCKMSARKRNSLLKSSDKNVASSSVAVIIMMILIVIIIHLQMGNVGMKHYLTPLKIKVKFCFV